MKRLLSLVGLSIALALLVAACGTEALSRPEADEATLVALGQITLEPTNTEAPTEVPPTEAPTEVPPTEAPTEMPTEVPPTEVPTEVPTLAPTDVPTEVPTLAPTVAPTTAPAVAPTTGAAAASVPSEEEIAAAVAAADAINGGTLVNVVAPPCSSCHSFTAETQIVGPGLWNLVNRAGSRVAGQGPYTYTFTSILYSQDHIVEGFVAGLMPNYAGVISEDEVYDIIAYLWTLHD